MTYLELYHPYSPACTWNGNLFLAAYQGEGNIACVVIILPEEKTVRTILHSSREQCYPYANGQYITFSVGGSYATKQDCIT
jgi:hypothetical protein